VSLRVEDERPRALAGGTADALTFAFGDPHTRLYGMARAGLAEGGASGIGLLFADGAPVAARAAGAVAVPEPAWEAIDAAGVRTLVEEALHVWRVTFDGGSQGGFDLVFTALGAGAELDPDGPAGAASASAGYDHLCVVRGSVRVAGRERRIECLGQRGRLWGAPDWERLELTRTVSAWLGEDLGATLRAVRPAGVRGHDEEALSAAVWEGGPVVAVPVGEPRLSTTSDGTGRQRAAGLELWTGDDEGHPLRGAGQAVCGTTLELGRLRLDVAFFAWQMEGREGAGRYEVLRRA
jgi:hypothetical protein